MLTLTFKAAREAGACRGNYRKFAEFKGGIKNWGANRPFPLTEVLEVNGLNDALWGLRCCEPKVERDKIARLFACDCAERVLPLFEKEEPNDKRPRQTIEVARKYARSEATQEELDTAWDAARVAAWTADGAAAEDAARAAAWAAAWDAAWAAAWDAAGAAAKAAAGAAAWAAAWDAEREWQKQHLLIQLVDEVTSH